MCTCLKVRNPFLSSSGCNLTKKVKWKSIVCCVLASQQLFDFITIYLLIETQKVIKLKIVRKFSMSAAQKLISCKKKIRKAASILQLM